MKNKIILFFVIGVLAGSTIFAQSLTPVVISSSGGYYSSAAGSLSATVAEMTMVQTFTSMGNFLTQGFQQPEEWYASVKEEQVPGNISIYPNPSNGKFSITVNSKENGLARIQLYDVLGQITFSRQMDISTGLNTENIDISRYSMGLYFLEYLYTGNNGKKESKVIKINIVN